MKLNDIYVLLSIILTALNIYQFFSAHKDKQAIKGLVRSWQNHAEGIKNALLQISMTPVHQLEKEKLLGSIQVLAQQASALDKAMTEERFYDDKELKKKKEENDKVFQQFLKPKTS